MAKIHEAYLKITKYKVVGWDAFAGHTGLIDLRVYCELNNCSGEGASAYQSLDADHVWTEVDWLGCEDGAAIKLTVPRFYRHIKSLGWVFDEDLGMGGEWTCPTCNTNINTPHTGTP